MEDGTKNTDHLVKIKKAKVESSPKIKTMMRATQTEKVVFASDLDYAGALKLARSLGTKDTSVKPG